MKGLALEGRFGKGSLGYGLTFGLPLHVFVCCCWGGRVAPLRAWNKSSLTLFSLLRLSSLSPLVVICANGFVVVCLLMGWNGCRLVCLFGVAGGRAVPSGGARQKLNRFWLSVIRSSYHARVGGLAQALFRSLGFSAPPFPSLLSLLLLGICLSICWWGGSVCSSANLGPRWAKYLQKNHVFPLCTLCPPSCFSVFYVAFLFLYSYRDDRVVSWPVVLYVSIYLERLFQREHEARAHWHCVHFFVVFLFLCLFLLLIAFGWKAWLLKGGPAKLSQVKLWHYFEQGRLGKIPSAMVLLLAFLYMCLSFVAGVEGLSH